MNQECFERTYVYFEFFFPNSVVEKVQKIPDLKSLFYFSTDRLSSISHTCHTYYTEIGGRYKVCIK